MTDLIPAGTKVVVSATASGTSRRALLTDDENAWTAPSSPAHIVLAFSEPIAAQRLALTFQGGFAATTIGLTATVDGEETSLGKVYPEDVNRRQVFDITPATLSRLRLELEGSTDNQGRITLYRVELL